jgi:hypothetical protein
MEVTEILEFISQNSEIKFDISERYSKLKIFLEEENPDAKIPIPPMESASEIASALPEQVFEHAKHRISEKLDSIIFEISENFPDILQDARWLWQAKNRSLTIDLVASIDVHQNLEVAESYFKLCLQILWHHVEEKLKYETRAFLVKFHENSIEIRENLKMADITWARATPGDSITFLEAFQDFSETTPFLMTPVLSFARPAAMVGGLGGLLLGASGGGVLNAVALGVLGSVAVPVSLVLGSAAALAGITAGLAAGVTGGSGWWGWGGGWRGGWGGGRGGTEVEGGGEGGEGEGGGAVEEGGTHLPPNFKIEDVEAEAARVATEMLKKTETRSAIHENLAHVLSRIFRSSEIPSELVQKQISVLSSSQRFFSLSTDFSRWRVVSVKFDETSVSEEPAVKFLVHVLHDGKIISTAHRFSEFRKLLGELVTRFPENSEISASFPPRTVFKSKEVGFLQGRSQGLLKWLEVCEGEEGVWEDRGLRDFLGIGEGEQGAGAQGEGEQGAGARKEGEITGEGKEESGQIHKKREGEEEEEEGEGGEGESQEKGEEDKWVWEDEEFSEG